MLPCYTYRIHTYCLILSQASDNCNYTLWIHTLDNNRHYTNEITTKIVTKSNLTWVFYLFIKAVVSLIQHFFLSILLLLVIIFEHQYTKQK